MNNFLEVDSLFYFQKEFKLSTGNNLFLRNAITTDAETVVQFFKLASDESENLSFSSDEYFVTPYEEKILISNINKNSKSIMLLGFIDDVLCCIAELISPTEIRLSHNVEYSITIVKNFWGMGIGNIVTKELINFAKYKGIKNIILTVKGENSAAINLYKKYGFKTVGIKKDYICIDGNYDDEITMQLQLN